MSISDIPFPLFMTVNMALTMGVFSFFGTYFIQHSKVSSTTERIAKSAVSSVQFASLTAAGFGALFAVMYAGMFLTKCIWAAYLYVIA